MRSSGAVLRDRIAVASLLLVGCSAKARNGTPSQENSLLAPSARECAFRSACGGEAVGDCLRFVRGSDVFDVEGQAHAYSVDAHTHYL